MRERSVCMCVVLSENEKEKKNKNESADQIEKRENCEICAGGGWVRWGTCGPKNQTSFFFFFPYWVGLLHFVSQSPHPGILVAKSAKRGIRVCEEMRPMPKICPKHSSTGRSPQSFVQPLAFRSMGLGYYRSFL